eukprot:jgi/Botrbrau1/11692/Bobra.0195s0023.1
MVADNDSFEEAMSPWIVQYKTLRMKREIGTGSAGTVYLASFKETNVAVKKLNMVNRGGTIDTSILKTRAESDKGSPSGSDLDYSADRRSSSSWRSLHREVNILASLRHPNIVMFMGVCLDPPCLITEWCARGSLADILQKALTQPDVASQLSWFRRLVIALEVAKLHEHTPTILHRDLKAGNVLVDSAWHCKVADFNLSYMEGTPAILCYSNADNPRWMAPEVMNGEPHTKASDVYSFGLILWELMTWQQPWADLSPPQVVIAIAQRKERPEIPEKPPYVAWWNFQ